MKSPRLLLVLCALLALLVAGCGGKSSSGSVPSGAVAKVGDQTITKDQFDALLAQAKHSYKLQKRQFPKPGTADYAQLRNQALQFLVQRTEREQKAKELGIEISDKKVNDRLKQIKKQYFGGSEKRYRAQLKQQGLTDDAVRATIKDQLISEAVYKKVTSDVKVTDAGIKRYYESHKSQYGQPETRDVRHILVKTKPLADKIYGQLKGGADFAALAKKYSQDPGSKLQGGKLCVARTQSPPPCIPTVPEFAKVAFSLKKNEIGKPVHTQFGWHVIQALSGIKPAKTTPFKQVKESIRQQLLQTKRSEAMAKWADETKKEFAKKVKYATGYAPPSTETTATTSTG